MSQVIQNFKTVLTQLQPTFKALGFAQLSSSEENGGATVYFSGEKGTLRFDFADGKLSVFGTNVEHESAQEGDYKKLSTSLIEEESTSGDIKFVAEDIAETLTAKFGEKAKAITKGGKNSYQTVSKAAAKSGVSYDATTFASRLCLVFPELRPEFKANIDTYGEFLCEEFFVNFGTPAIIEAIRQNNPAVMKKLFTLLNEMFDDGSNEVQDIIAVTVLGELNNDTMLLANCVDYMSTAMAPTVIEVNRILADNKPSGRKLRAKLKNPPAYKPKKKKSGGLMQTLMGGGAQPGM